MVFSFESTIEGNDIIMLLTFLLAFLYLNNNNKKHLTVCAKKKGFCFSKNNLKIKKKDDNFHKSEALKW